MGVAAANRVSPAPGWLLFFYSVPSRPVSNRMKVWRRLAKAGAVALKSAVYILPFSDEHYELLQWLVSEIVGMKGEAAFTRIKHIDTMKDSELVTLFDQQRAADYRGLGKKLEELERKLGSIRQGGRADKGSAALTEQFSRLQKEFGEVSKIDFFSSKEGEALNGKLRRGLAELHKLAAPGVKQPLPAAIAPREAAAYQGRVWVTRRKPFVDRMASAWLIRRFIDRSATFAFIEERELETLPRETVAFDLRGGEFTHVGDLCTFEVLVRAFGIKDKTVKQLAETVHDLDTKDRKYGLEEAKGIEDVLTGIRRTARDDREALEKGMGVFEMLYAAHA